MDTAPRGRHTSIDSTQEGLKIAPSGAPLVPWTHEKPPGIREIALEQVFPPSGTSLGDISRITRNLTIRHQEPM